MFVILKNKSNCYEDLLNYNILILLGLLFGFIGDFVLFDTKQIGNTFFVSLIGLLYIYYMCLYFNLKLIRIFDNIESISLMYTFGKIGCFYGNCCNGFINFSNFHMPIQFIESFSHMVMFLILIRINKINRIFVFFLINFIFRMFFLVFRDDRYNTLNMFKHDILFISLLVFIIGLFLVYKILKKKIT